MTYFFLKLMDETPWDEMQIHLSSERRLYDVDLQSDCILCVFDIMNVESNHSIVSLVINVVMVLLGVVLSLKIMLNMVMVSISLL